MNGQPQNKGGTRPSELAITLAALPGRYGARDGWVAADEVRGRLRLLGFDATAQQVAAWLRRMSRVDAPWIETREATWGREYRVTVYGRTDIHNRFEGIEPVMPWIPMVRYPSQPPNDARRMSCSAPFEPTQGSGRTGGETDRSTAHPEGGSHGA